MTAVNIVTGKDMHIIYLNGMVPSGDSDFILDARLPSNVQEFDKAIMESFGFSQESSSLTNEDVVQIAKVYRLLWKNQKIQISETSHFQNFMSQQIKLINKSFNCA